jgi:hypothetical protein
MTPMILAINIATISKATGNKYSKLTKTLKYLQNF